MAYATLADIQNRWPTMYTELSTLIAGFITDSDKEIDDILYSGDYQAPIVGTVPGLIKQLSILKVGVKGWENLYEAEGKESAKDAIDAWKEQIEKIESKIISGEIDLNITSIDMSPDSSGDALEIPDISQFPLNPGVELPTVDINA